MKPRKQLVGDAHVRPSHSIIHAYYHDNDYGKSVMAGSLLDSIVNRACERGAYEAKISHLTEVYTHVSIHSNDHGSSLLAVLMHSPPANLPQVNEAFQTTEGYLRESVQCLLSDLTRIQEFTVGVQT